MIKVLRESLVVTNVHRVLGIVNGTTNFILTRMEAGGSYEEALAEAQRLGYAEADPTDDVSGADAAAKMAILATVAFGSRVELDDVDVRGDRPRSRRSTSPPRASSTWSCGSSAPPRSSTARSTSASAPRSSTAHHPLAAVEGPFNAVMLQGDAIREIMLEGPGAGGIETASAVVADMVSVVGTTGTGFLQNDACWRELPTLPTGELPSPFYVRLDGRRPAGRARARRRALRRDEGVSIAQLSQQVAERQRRPRRRHRTSAPLGARRRRARRGSRALARGARRAPSRCASSSSAASEAVTAERHARARARRRCCSAPRLSERLGVELWLKWEGANPTGSFKDRGMAVAVSRALERGAPGVVCASTGNTAASAAAYAARAGLPA